jgi:hypothetical protein
MRRKWTPPTSTRKMAEIATRESERERCDVITVEGTIGPGIVRVSVTRVRI